MDRRRAEDGREGTGGEGREQGDGVIEEAKMRGRVGAGV